MTMLGRRSSGIQQTQLIQRFVTSIEKADPSAWVITPWAT